MLDIFKMMLLILLFIPQVKLFFDSVRENRSSILILRICFKLILSSWQYWFLNEAFFSRRFPQTLYLLLPVILFLPKDASELLPGGHLVYELIRRNVSMKSTLANVTVLTLFS